MGETGPMNGDSFNIARDDASYGIGHLNMDAGDRETQPSNKLEMLLE